MEYIKIVDNKIAAHYCARSIPESKPGLVFQEVHGLSGGAVVGTLVTQLDSSGRLRTPEELINLKILKKDENETIVYEDGSYVVKADYTDKQYWNKETGELVEFQFGDEPDDTMTDVENHDHAATWNGQEWIVEDEILATRIREERDYHLEKTDYLVLPDAPIVDKQNIIKYRQELRDLPLQATFPKSVVWPIQP